LDIKTRLLWLLPHKDNLYLSQPKLPSTVN
jgi:hypothetical protein